MRNITDRAFAPRRTASALAALAVITLPLAACTEPETVEPAIRTAPPLDGDWITIDGRVVSAGPEAFVVDYGTDQITVEVDGWGFYRQGAALLPGDRVIVSGRVDENLFAADTIEARSVYVANLDTTFFGSTIDDEAFGTATVPTFGTTPDVEYTGWVTGTSQNAFTLGAGPTTITVDVSGLDTNPLQNGRIETGDRVSVWGDFRFGPDGGSRVRADSVIELSRDTGTATGAAGGAEGGAGTEDAAAGAAGGQQTAG